MPDGTVRARRPGGDQPDLGTQRLSVDALVDRLKRRYAARITGTIDLPAREARYCDLPSTLDPRIARALRARGIERLYTHQGEAWRVAAAGDHLVVVTPTASGKTLCYNLPVLDAVVREGCKALYLFPTKALAQDQVAELLELNDAGALGVRAFTFDGDTPGDARAAVRVHGDIVVSNPDMLHQAILPHHTKWAQFFERLRFVVIDEMHVYRGVFGSHVANVIRRLRRIAEFYGSRPQFVLASATIANPAELAARLVGDPVRAITTSGAPQGRRHVLLWNPPVINPDLGLRASSRSQVSRIARYTVRAGLKTVIFANTRLMVEVITKYMKDVFDRDPRQPTRVSAYRGGYLPTERRGTERRLRAGDIDCVVSTSALELGVDIGGLDVCLLNGYPGTIAATWQRIGRAGRRSRSSLAVLVANSEPLDQYLVRHPDFFSGAPVEHARVDPDQLLVLMDHVRCAAFELPFVSGETFGGQPVDELLQYLAENGVLHLESDRWHWMADSYPANAVSLRALAEGNFVVVDITGSDRDIIAEVDYFSAPVTLYEGAIYLLQAQPWQVERLDWEGRKAFVRRTEADYYTDAIDYTRLKILDRFEQSRHGAAVCERGEVHLVRRIAGYKKIRYYTHENVGYGQIALPDQEMHTTAVWWQVDPTALAGAFESRTEALDGFLGAAYALHWVAALLSMAERQDIGRSVGDSDGRWVAGGGGRGTPRALDGAPVDIDAAGARFTPTVYLYDNFPGGIGLTAPLYDLRSRIVAHALAAVRECACPSGCPACIGPVLASDEGSERTPKQAALRVLALLAAPPTAPASPGGDEAAWISASA
jgi:DEAD/DEAH box helicase domain-containing protein